MAAERYPLNEVCAHPYCDRPADDPHHIFPRSSIGNDSWFVEISDVHLTTTIPHVTGLCRTHHDIVELHDGWIKLEEGKFVWYTRWPGEEEWKVDAPLDPQPAGRQKVNGKRKKREKTTEAAKPKGTVGIRVPKDEKENGAELLLAKIQEAREKLIPVFNWKEDVPAYYVLYAVLTDWLNDN